MLVSLSPALYLSGRYVVQISTLGFTLNIFWTIFVTGFIICVVFSMLNQELLSGSKESCGNTLTEMVYIP